MYDVIIIGGGPAGYHAAFRLDEEGKKVLLIEKSKIGGVCLHEGCIPTKSILNEVKSGDLDENAINIKRNQDVRKLFQGLQHKINNSDIVVVNGHGTILGKNKNFFLIEVNEDVYTSPNIIIATGSKYIEAKIEGFDEAFKSGRAVYSSQFLSRDSIIPQNVSIIGGGIVGVEIASYLCSLGKNVTVFEKRKELLETILDDDIRSIVLDKLKKQGCNFIFNSDVIEISDESIVYGINNEFQEIKTDYTIYVAGRKASVDKLGLETVDIKISNKGIVVDNNFETSEKGIYACGDVIGTNMLAHAAFYEADVAVDSILGLNISCDSVIPSIIYGELEVAVVGISEKECINSNMEYFVRKQSMNYSSRYFVENNNYSGICKLIFDKNEVLIGAQIVGKQVSEVIFPLAEMINHKETLNQIYRKVYPHPSVVEIIRETIENIL